MPFEEASVEAVHSRRIINGYLEIGRQGNRASIISSAEAPPTIMHTLDIESYRKSIVRLGSFSFAINERHRLMCGPKSPLRAQ